MSRVSRGNPLISVKGVSKRFGGRLVLNNVSLEIPEGSRIGVIGKMGVGKSTLIHAIARIRGYEPTEGNIFFNVAECEDCGWVDFPSSKRCRRCGNDLTSREIDIWSEPNPDLVRRIRSRVGIVLQKSFAVYGNFSTLENVVETLRQAGHDQKSVYQTAAGLLQSVNLLHRSSHVARDLSGGEKQRLVLARQLAKDPMVLLADDPTGALDTENADNLCRMLGAAVSGRAVLVTSHMPRVIKTLSQTAILMEDGEVKAVGDASKIVDGFVNSNALPVVERQEQGKEEIIRLENISKTYHKSSSGVVKALDGVSLEVYRGSILGVVGRSGAGKTTLTRIIAGAIQPTGGLACIRIGDEWVSMKDPGEFGRGRATRYTGMLYQEYSLYSGMSVFENLAKSSITDLPDEFMKLKIRHILRRIGFTEDRIQTLLNEYPDELSEGERHRVALARVMVRDPTILILDEPSSTMDPSSKTEVSNALKRLANEYKTTVIVVSHEEEFAAQTCDRIVRMDGGRIVG